MANSFCIYYILEQIFGLTNKKQISVKKKHKLLFSIHIYHLPVASLTHLAYQLLKILNCKYDWEWKEEGPPTAPSS